MKRSLAVALVLLLCFIAVSAFAEEIDLGSMSLDELQTLHRRINEEVSSRFPPESSPFGSGVYIAGKSIKLGSYTFTVTETFGIVSFVQVWQSEEDYAEGSSASSYDEITLNAAGQIVTLNFTEGTVIVINNASGVISPVIASWVP